MAWHHSGQSPTALPPGLATSVTVLGSLDLYHLPDASLPPGWHAVGGDGPSTPQPGLLADGAPLDEHPAPL